MPDLIPSFRGELECLSVSWEMFFVAKRVYEYNPQKAVGVLGNYLDYDYCCDMMWDALNACYGTVIAENRQDYYVHYYFSDPILLDYYSLCARHAKLAGVSYKKDPFYQKAAYTVSCCLQEAACNIQEYATYSLAANPMTADRCGISLDSELYWADYPPFVMAMVDIIEFYDVARKELQKEIARLEQMQYGFTVISCKKRPRSKKKGAEAA